MKEQVFAGIDVGGTSIKCALGTSQGKLVAQKAIPTDAYHGPEDVLDRIALTVGEMQAQIDAEFVLAGLGMGVPGLVDIQTGVTKFLPNLHTQWREVPVADILSEKLGCGVKLLNDVRAATLGELKFGHGQSKSDLTMVFFAIGTGVGGGIVIEGKLRLGNLGAAGELGHQTLIANGHPCGCGNNGCMETLVSGPAITAEGVRLLLTGQAPKLNELVQGEIHQVTPKLMFQAANAGDVHVHAALLTAANYVGIAAANVVTILYPELIVLGGGVAEMGDLLINEVKKVIKQRVGMIDTETVRVEKSLLGDQAGVKGAVALGMMVDSKI